MYNELKDLMVQYNITQQYIADKIGVSRELVALVLNERRRDRREIVNTCLDEIEKAHNKLITERTNVKKRIQRLTSASVA